MKRKMALLEQAHGLLCNAPSDATSAEDGERWVKLRSEWIARWEHVIRDQRTKEHNRRIAVGNDAIDAFQRRAARSGVELRANDATPEPVAVCSKCGTAGCLEDARSGWHDDPVLAEAAYHCGCGRALPCRHCPEETTDATA